MAAYINNIGRDIVVWSNPAMDYSTRATRGWPFIELSEALAVAGAYLVLVLYGYSKYQQHVAATKGAAPAPKEARLRGIAKLNADPQFPLVWLLFLYNIVQVVLCTYMMYMAFTIARDNYPGLICNPHNTTDSKLAPILWLFYVSKVRVRGRRRSSPHGRPSSSPPAHDSPPIAAFIPTPPLPLPRRSSTSSTPL